MSSHLMPKRALSNRHRSKAKRPVGVLLTAAVSLLLPAVAGAQPPSCQGATYNCFILRAASADVATVLQAHALNEVADVRPGEPALKLVTGPGNVLPETTLANLEADAMVVAVELVETQAVTESAAAAAVDATEPTFVSTLDSSGTYNGPGSSLFQTSLWSGYAEQPLLGIIGVPQAHADPRPESLGTGVVAIIDTGVDPDHPALQGALVPGYDFLLDQPGIASEWEALDPASRAQDETDLRAIADQSYGSILDGDGITVSKGPAAEALVDQSYGSILDDKDLPEGFGHGTMVAGLVRIVAPGALIMPLRVFDGDGEASLGDIIRAIYYAADAGANVINMSFSTEEDSAELRAAIDYAEQQGAVMVASVGNEGYSWGPLCYLPGASCGLRFPASYDNVLGIASTTTQDVRSGWSNGGLGIVLVGAPGEGLVTTYPGGLYAGVWGTSFSAALVAGTVSLMHDIKGNNHHPISHDEAHTEFINSAAAFGDLSLGWGRLDTFKAMDCALTNGPC